MAVAPTTPDDMKERIRQVCTEITPQMLAEVRRSFHQRISKYLQVEGHYFIASSVDRPKPGLVGIL